MLSRRFQKHAARVEGPRVGWLDPGPQVEKSLLGCDAALPKELCLCPGPRGGRACTPLQLRAGVLVD